MSKQYSNKNIQGTELKKPDEYFAAAREKFRSGVDTKDRTATEYYQRLLGASDKYFNDVVTRVGYGHHGDYTSQAARKMQEKLGLEKTGKPDEALLYGLELARDNCGYVNAEIRKKTAVFRDILKEEKKSGAEIDYKALEDKVENIAKIAKSTLESDTKFTAKSIYEPDNERFDGREMKILETGKVTGYARGCNDGYTNTAMGKGTLDNESHTFATPLRYRGVEGKPQLGQIAEFTCDRTGKTKFGMCENYGSIKGADADFTPGMASALGLTTIAAQNGAIKQIGITEVNSKGKEYLSQLNRGDIEGRVVADTGVATYFIAEKRSPAVGAKLRDFSQHMEVVVKDVNEKMDKGMSREQGLGIIREEISSFYHQNPEVSRVVNEVKSKPKGREYVEHKPKNGDVAAVNPVILNNGSAKVNSNLIG